MEHSPATANEIFRSNRCTSTKPHKMGTTKWGRRDYFLTKIMLWDRLSVALKPFAAKGFRVQVRKDIPTYMELRIKLVK
jgi:hypothetical protein